MLRATVRDSRGKVVPLVPHDWTLLKRDDERSRRLLRAADLPRELTTWGEIWRGIGYGSLMLPLLLAGALAPVYVTSLVKPPWLAIPLVLPTAIIPAAVTIFVARRAAGRRIARMYACAEFCGSCGFELRGLADDTDGCRVCPECGAAWRVG